MGVNDTEYSHRTVFYEAIPVGVTIQRHNFIDFGILFYKVTDFPRVINIPFLPYRFFVVNSAIEMNQINSAIKMNFNLHL